MYLPVAARKGLGNVSEIKKKNKRRKKGLVEKVVSLMLKPFKTISAYLCQKRGGY